MSVNIISFEGKFATISENKTLLYIVSEEEYKKLETVVNQLISDYKGEGAIFYLPIWTYPSATGVEHFVKVSLDQFDRLKCNLKRRAENIGKMQSVKIVTAYTKPSPQANDLVGKAGIDTRLVTARNIS